MIMIIQKKHVYNIMKVHRYNDESNNDDNLIEKQ